MHIVQISSRIYCSSLLFTKSARLLPDNLFSDNSLNKEIKFRKCFKKTLWLKSVSEKSYRPKQLFHYFGFYVFNNRLNS